MRIEVRDEPITSLGEYASIPIAFEVGSILHVQASPNGLGEFLLTEQHLDSPYVKDYDSIDGEGPAQWARGFDMSNWALFAARAAGRRVGGAVVAFGTPGLTLFEGREDLAVLWDIRVLPEARGQGVGSALFREAEAWARAKGCRQLKVETQNINVGACRFYARQGCVLRAVNRLAYREFPNEEQMLWYKDLSASQASA
jgi:GNAT superfamily N-acetyltransferase